MKDQSYTTTFMVDQTPEEVFEAINNVRGWWPEKVEGKTDKIGAEFTFSDQYLRSRQKITEFVPGKKVVWHVFDSHLSFIDKKDEWNGTDIVFEIAKKKDKTELRFTHVGLTPRFLCYGDCSTGWDSCINDNLRKLITTSSN